MRVFIVAVVTFLLFASSVNAYGGSGGFPSGFSFIPKVKLQCEPASVNVPFLRRPITVSRCRLVRTDLSENDYKKRMEDFWNRVENGGS